MVTILIKLKNKSILFENIQGFVSQRHYILPYLINSDKIYQKKLKIFNGISKDNKLSTNFIDNLFTFISDRILFRILNEEKDIMDNTQYVPEDDEKNKFQILKKRIFNIYKGYKYYNETNININNLKKYFPKEREFALFLFDFLETKKQILSFFPGYYIQHKININNFFSYYEKNKILFENKEKINQTSIKETEKIYYQMNRKVLINIVFIGNQSSGKSTTIGHLLYNTGNIEEAHFTKMKNLADELGSRTYKFSYLIDELKEEKEKRKTVICHFNKFETKKYVFNLINIPGDFSLRKNIIKGISLGDAAVIVVSAENYISENNNHIKDYLIIAFTMGIRQIIIAINKMDQTKDLKYSEKIFLDMKKNMMNLCINVGYNIDDIQFIPYSGYTGQNLVEKYEDEDILKKNKMEWYKGKTLLESLDEIKPPKRTLDEPLKISIFGADKVTGIGTIFEGKILSGQLEQDMKIIISLDKKITTIRIATIKMHHHYTNNLIDKAIAGDIIGFNVNLTKLEALSCKLAFEKSEMDFIKKADNLRVKILLINKKVTLKIGSDLTLFCYTLNIPIKIAKIEYIVDEANKILEKEPKEIKNGGYAIIIINIMDKKLHSWPSIKITPLFEKYEKNPFLGSFLLFNSELIGVGSIKDINVL